MTQTVLFHTHGIGSLDFSSLQASGLVTLDAAAAQRGAFVCPTIYLLEERFRAFGELLAAFAELKSGGALPRILGFSIEGPVLGSQGGIPSGSVWRPTVRQWQEMSSWFALGLRYVVLAPDALSLSDEIGDGATFGDVLSGIYDSGGRVALGHFAGASPHESARKVGDVLDFLEGKFAPSPYLVLTDHLFNDMPRNFRHALRGEAALEARKHERSALFDSLTLSDRPDLRSILGPVPAVLLTAARDGRLTPALNFDGGHVDLDICKWVVDYLGPARLIAMTDHTEVHALAGEPLSLDRSGRLLYRADGVLAASAVGEGLQIENMNRIGLSSDAIAGLFYHTPLAALTFSPRRREA